MVVIQLFFQILLQIIENFYLSFGKYITLINFADLIWELLRQISQLYFVNNIIDEKF